MKVHELKVRYRIFINLNANTKRVSIDVYPTADCYTDFMPDDESLVYEHGTIALFHEGPLDKAVIQAKVNNALNEYRRTCSEVVQTFQAYIEAIDNGVN